MQFKHPEILWALLLLLIPIFIHLFQLRRFRKEPFTNVTMLKKVISESRKSSSLKKWLLLFTRLALIAALIIAFAQPFVASEKALKPMETVVYLDNSFSMQARSGGVSLLKKATQDLIQNIGEESVFSLFTNDLVFRDVKIKDLQNQLLELGYTANQYSIKDVLLKAETLFSKNDANTKKLVLLSDFQNRQVDSVGEERFEMHYVQLKPDSQQNIAIDSASVNANTNNQSNLAIWLTGIPDGNIPISLYNGANLIAKSSANFGAKGRARVEFSLPQKEQIDGLIEIADSGLLYDNTFYFNINETKRIKVLAVSEAPGQYLARLFPSDEFEFEYSSLTQLNYSKIEGQNIVVLDNLPGIPESLRRTLKDFYDKGGSLVIIPSAEANLTSYNAILVDFGIALKELERVEENVSTIAFGHPLYQNVFEKNVTNFQYPKVSSYFTASSKASTILSFAGGEPFLMGGNRFYLFTASLTIENSNFKNSPLIVPTFYNMAQFSLKSPNLYFMLGQENQTDIPISLSQDNILSLSKDESEIIPRQQSFNNKVSLFFGENPQEAGIYSIKNKDSVLEKVSFNYERNESSLIYTSLNNSGSFEGQNAIASLFDFIKSENEQTAYWKWFVILALIFALAEALIQKIIT